MKSVPENISPVDTAGYCQRVEPLAKRSVVLRIRDLRKSFGGQVVLDGASAELREGEIVLLQGDNGSGKTTLLNILSGNLEPDSGFIDLRINGASEDFAFPRRWWQNLNPFDHFTPERVAREGVGRTWQDVRLFGTMALAENIAVATPHQPGENPFSVFFQPGKTRRKELENLQAASIRLDGLGLKGREFSSADRISLGQTKRVAIARAVQAGARILFLDEPLAGLDSGGIENVLNLLRELVREHRVTVVVIEHVFNIPRILDLADAVWTLQNGKINVETPATIREQRTGSDADIVSWAIEQLGRESTVSNEPLTEGAVLWRIQNSQSNIQRSATPLLEVRELVVRRGKRIVVGREESDEAVQGLSFSIARGEILILQAPNGWGKTTLADAIAGLIPIEGGEIRLAGKRVENLPAWERARSGLSFLPAKNTLFPNLTVRENLRLANTSRDSDSFAGHQARSVGSLSGGERQRVSLATVKPSCFGIYDEPFSALDKSTLAGQLRTISEQHESTLILLPYA